MEQISLLCSRVGAPICIDQFGWRSDDVVKKFGALLTSSGVVAFISFVAVGPLTKVIVSICFKNLKQWETCIMLFMAEGYRFLLHTELWRGWVSCNLLKVPYEVRTFSPQP